MAKREIIALLKKYVEVLRNEGISVYKAYLFGSYAKNTANDFSDIDVMIVSDNYDETNDMVTGKIWSLTTRVNTRIEPLLVGLKKFTNDRVSPLIKLVETEGIEIV